MPENNYNKASLFALSSVGLLFVTIIYLSHQHWTLHSTSFRITVVSTLKSQTDKIYSDIFKSYGIIANTSVVIDLTTAPPEKSQVNKTGRYVTMCKQNFDDRRLGNQLFNFAAMLYVARLTGRRVAMVWRHPHGWLDRWFDVSVTRVDRIDLELCPCLTVGESVGLAYYSQMAMLSNRTDIAGKSLLVCGWFQSWKYTVGIESTLRYHLRLLPNVSAATHNYMDKIRPYTWQEKSFIRIGIHVRAGDVMRRDKWHYGYTIPQRPYFEQAMSRFVTEQRRRGGGRVQFIVTSDNVAWTKKAINFTSIAQQLNSTSSTTKDAIIVDLTHAEGHDAGFDLAVLSMCDGLIMSTGTYGWWGAWLANKTTVYYSNWPRVGSPLFGLFNRNDYFPPHWIPIGGPSFPCCQA